MTSTSGGTCSSATGPDEEEPAQDVKGKHFDKEGSVTTEDGFTDSNRDVKRSSGPAGTERQENTPDRFDILGQYIAQTLRELSPEVSSVKILEITTVLHTSTASTSNSKVNATKTSQNNRR
ncbi:hypothetical protein TELCIR_20695 [Teladorsagia circumcincta]|uniref:Uncharacterized protein n=1 Tax=Teladorsagia circumcincta TaxID=45464 RepID=A0A2G9TIW8_TELCI|nr:hypothetical protein TELCIR_20695 [Teladorsagia circumcincta]